MSNPPAGWYPDPTGQPDTIRWWNGSQWTNRAEKEEPDSEPVNNAAPSWKPVDAAPSEATGDAAAGPTDTADASAVTTSPAGPAASTASTTSTGSMGSMGSTAELTPAEKAKSTWMAPAELPAAAGHWTQRPAPPEDAEPVISEQAEPAPDQQTGWTLKLATDSSGTTPAPVPEPEAESWSTTNWTQPPTVAPTPKDPTPSPNADTTQEISTSAPQPTNGRGEQPDTQPADNHWGQQPDLAPAENGWGQQPSNTPAETGWGQQGGSAAGPAEGGWSQSSGAQVEGAAAGAWGQEPQAAANGWSQTGQPAGDQQGDGNRNQWGSSNTQQTSGDGWGTTGVQESAAGQWGSTGQQQTGGAPQGGEAPPWQGGGDPQGGGTRKGKGGGGGGTSKTPLIIGGAVALVILIVVAVLLVTSQGDKKTADPSNSPTPQPTTSGPSTPAANAGQSKNPKLHEGNRISSDAISFPRQAGGWSDRKRLIPQLLDSSGQYVVLQADFDGSNDWYADMFVGGLGTGTPFSGDPKATALQLLQQVQKASYGDIPVSFKAIGGGEVKRSDKTGWYFKQSVTAKSPKVTSVLVLTVAVFDLGDGTAVAYVSDVPTNRPDLKTVESKVYEGINVG